MRARRLALVAVLLVPLAAACRSSGRPAAAPAGPAISFERPAVVGASVSAGFGASRVGVVLDRAVRGRHQVKDLAELGMFREPRASGARQVARAAEHAPTVVFAIDFLFWYAYGSGLSADERLARLDEGLAELARLGAVPLLVGDVPDMRNAAGWMLPAELVPPPEHLARVNTRLREWAGARPHVRVLPVAAWTAPLLDGGAVTIAPGRPPVAATSLMALDGLHPNEQGLLHLLRQVRAELLAGWPGTHPGALILPMSQ